MSLGRMEVLERPRSKWPYWLLYKADDWDHSIDYQHLLLKIDLMRDKIPVVVERQWGQCIGRSGRKHKKQYGILYKFLHAEDRLIFLMSQEAGNELH
jgi:hypothetical protein